MLHYISVLEEQASVFSNYTTWITIGMIVVIFVAFYFFGIRPQRKQEKETQNMLNELKVGDEITTIGGIIGKVVSIKDETILIETAHDRTRIRLLKNSVRRVDVHAEDAQN
ncbi:MAG: preprotein translocase subunit YajC [Clostridia bacterium]|nr:preprotein translocase subunit YajC [Clostridia bacterium]